MEVVGKFYDQGEHPQILTLPVFTIKDNVTRDFLLIFLHKTLSQSSKVASLSRISKSTCNFFVRYGRFHIFKLLLLVL